MPPSGMVGVEVWRCVGAFIPIHVDRNSPEVGDTGHPCDVNDRSGVDQPRLGSSSRDGSR